MVSLLRIGALNPQINSMRSLRITNYCRSFCPFIFSALILFCFSSSRLHGQCEDVSGVWQVHEKVLITLSAPGFPNETIDMDEVGMVTLAQNGCDISYSLPFAGSSFLRSGSIVDDTISFSGVAAVLAAGTTCSANKMTATGTIISQGRIEMTTSVNIVCTSGSINLTGTGTGTVVFTRNVVLPPVITFQPQDLTITELDDAVFGVFPFNCGKCYFR